MAGNHQQQQTPIRAALTEWGRWVRGEAERSPQISLIDGVVQSGLIPPDLLRIIRSYYVDTGPQKAKYRTMGASIYYTTKSNAEALISHLCDVISIDKRAE